MVNAALIFGLTAGLAVHVSASTILAPDVQAVPKCPTGKKAARGFTVFPSTAQNAVRVDNIAGLAISRKQTYLGGPLVWVVQDDASSPYLFAYSGATGVRVKRISLQNVLKTQSSVKDFEELAIGPCNPAPTVLIEGDNDDCLYIMDIGNKEARQSSPKGTRGRSSHFIYKVKEPSVSDTDVNVKDDVATANVQVIEFKYDQEIAAGVEKADAESGFLDEVTGKIYVLTKWDRSEEDWTRLFEIDPNLVGEAGVQTVKPVGLLNDRIRDEQWTRGTISRDGKVIMFGTSSESYLWVRDAVNGETIAEALTRDPCAIKLERPPTGSSYQAMTYDTVGAGFLEISKGNDQTLYYTQFEGMISVTEPINPGNPNPPDNNETPPPGGGFGTAESAGLRIEPLATTDSVVIGLVATVVVGMSVVVYETYTRRKGITGEVGTLEARRALNGNSWRAAQDSDGQVYFYNKHTLETSWHPPPGFQEL